MRSLRERLLLFLRIANLALATLPIPEEYPNQVPGQCKRNDMFDCGEGQCIAFAMVRDCIQDCQNGADESCGMGQVLCDQSIDKCGKCVRNASAHSSCMDRKWSALCDEPNIFHCKHTGNCVLPAWLNDGENDCADYSDEDPCLNGRVTCGQSDETTLSPLTVDKQTVLNRLPGSCSFDPLEFDCGNGECISAAQFGDCVVDCASGIDEACWDGQVKCPGSCKCVDQDKVREQCFTPYVCTSEQFECITGGCIPIFRVNDGTEDCSDGSDENYCDKYLTSCAAKEPCSFLPEEGKFGCGCPAHMTPDRSGICREGKEYPKDCADIQLADQSLGSGVYTVYRPSCLNPLSCTMSVLCDLETSGGGWTVIQKRTNGEESFYRTWEEYRNGFGRVGGDNHWIGNEYIYEITTAPNVTSYELLLKMQTTLGFPVSVHYTNFKLGSEDDDYKLHLGPVLVGAGDAMKKSKNRRFGTVDRDTDGLESISCGLWWRSGWWFDEECARSGNLNVPYSAEANSHHLNGIWWSGSRLKTVHMMVRPTGFRVLLSKATTNSESENQTEDGCSLLFISPTLVFLLLFHLFFI